MRYYGNILMTISLLCLKFQVGLCTLAIHLTPIEVAHAQCESLIQRIEAMMGFFVPRPSQFTHLQPLGSSVNIITETDSFMGRKTTKQSGYLTPENGNKQTKSNDKSQQKREKRESSFRGKSRSSCCNQGNWIQVGSFCVLS